MKNACFSLLVFREQWKCWTVYRGLIKCGQRGHIPTAKCWPPPPTQPNLHTHTPHRSKRPSPPFAPCHVHLLRGYYGCTSVWEVCSIWHLTFHCCSVLQRPLLGKILLSSLTSRSRNLLDTAAENSPGWIASASNNAQFHIGIHMYFFHCAALQKVMTFCFFKALIKKKDVSRVRLPQNSIFCCIRITTVLWLKETAWSALIGHLWFKFHLCFTRKHSERKGTSYYFSWLVYLKGWSKPGHLGERFSLRVSTK